MPSGLTTNECPSCGQTYADAKCAEIHFKGAHFEDWEVYTREAEKDKSYRCNYQGW